MVMETTKETPNFGEHLPSLKFIAKAENALQQSVVYAMFHPDTLLEMMLEGRYGTLQVLTMTPVSTYADSRYRVTRREKSIENVATLAGCGRVTPRQLEDLIAADCETLGLHLADRSLPLKMQLAIPYVMAAGGVFSIVDRRMENFYHGLVQDPGLAQALSATILNEALNESRILKRRIGEVSDPSRITIKDCRQTGPLHREIHDEVAIVWKHIRAQIRIAELIAEGCAPAEANAILVGEGVVHPDLMNRGALDDEETSIEEIFAMPEKIAGRLAIHLGEVTPQSYRQYRQVHRELCSALSIPARPSHGMSMYRVYDESGRSMPQGDIAAFLGTPVAGAIEFVPDPHERKKFLMAATPGIFEIRAIPPRHVGPPRKKRGDMADEQIQAPVKRQPVETGYDTYSLHLP